MTTNLSNAKTGRGAPRLQTNHGASPCPRKREPTPAPALPAKAGNLLGQRIYAKVSIGRGRDRRRRANWSPPR